MWFEFWGQQVNRTGVEEKWSHGSQQNRGGAGEAWRRRHGRGFPQMFHRIGCLMWNASSRARGVDHENVLWSGNLIWTACFISNSWNLSFHNSTGYMVSTGYFALCELIATIKMSRAYRWGFFSLSLASLCWSDIDDFFFLSCAVSITPRVWKCWQWMWVKLFEKDVDLGDNKLGTYQVRTNLSV